jgi:hypothetical protein
VVAIRGENRILQLVNLGLCFLYTDHIRLLIPQPFEEALACGCTYTIGITGDDFGHLETTRCLESGAV